MKEAISNSLILSLVIVFLVIFIILFAGYTAYSKAFKVKNRIISIIEKHERTIFYSGVNNAEVLDEIEQALGDAGYTIITKKDTKCSNAMKKRFENTNKNYKVVNTGSSTYRYCIAEFYDETAKMPGKYYAVITYMYFEIPVIGARLEFPVYGETKTLGMSY